MAAFFQQTEVLGTTWTLVYTSPAVPVSYHVFMLNRSKTVAASMSVAIGTEASPTTVNTMLQSYSIAANQNQIGIQTVILHANVNLPI